MDLAINGYVQLSSQHPASSLLYCIFFFEEINSCLKETLLAVIRLFGPGMNSGDGAWRKTKQQDRKKQMVLNKHCEDNV